MRMPAPRRPCPCPRCNGALVSASTLRRHASRVANSLPTFVPSFSAWSHRHWHSDTIARQSSSSPGPLNSDDNNKDYGLYHDNQYPWPSKRLRFSRGDQHNVNIDIHNDPNDSLVHDGPNNSLIQDTSHHRHDTIDTLPPENDNFDADDLDKYELRDAELQAEWQARAAAIQAPSQLGPGLDESPTTGNDSKEAGDSPTAISHIKSIKITHEYIKEIRAATLGNGNLDEDVIHRRRNPPEEPTRLSAAPSNSIKAKAGKLMVASSTVLSARNLFAVDYLKGHSPTISEFKTIWDNTPPETKKKYEALSKERKAASRRAAAARHSDVVD